MKVLLILPSGENVRVTREKPRVPKRAMLRFSVLPLTTVAAGTRGELLRTSHCWLDAGIVRGETRVDLSPRQQARTDHWPKPVKKYCCGRERDLQMPAEAGVRGRIKS